MSTPAATPQKTTTDTTEQSPLPKLEESRITGPGRPAQLPMGKRLPLAVINGTDAGKSTHGEAAHHHRPLRRRSDHHDTEASRLHAVVEVRDSVICLEDLKVDERDAVDAEDHGAGRVDNQSEFQIAGRRSC